MIQNKYPSFENNTERCVLAGLVRSGESRWQLEDQLKELQALAKTSGALVIETFIQERTAPDPAYFIGKGKIEEIRLFVEMNEVNLVIFDDELSPAQARNIANALSVKVVDRPALILDIFAMHARSRQTRLQVELAQLNYLLPRLTRQWQHLSRQIGGIGTKGPGETQLESDRRLVRRRIAHLREQLKHIDRQKNTQRRQRQDFFRAALIGYTNAGKSTLLKALTGADVLVEDQLFATLDTTVRRLTLSERTTILLSDTVGFIRKLPHQLVASFRTTLAETLEADLLIHVVDISHPRFREHIDVVSRLLNELELSGKPRLLVFNKTDRAKNQTDLLKQIKTLFPEALFISASRHIGLNHLKTDLQKIAESEYETLQLRLNYHNGAAEHLLYPLATILHKHTDEQYLYLTVKFSKQNRTQIQTIANKFR